MDNNPAGKTNYQQHPTPELRKKKFLPQIVSGGDYIYMIASATSEKWNTASALVRFFFILQGCYIHTRRLARNTRSLVGSTCVTVSADRQPRGDKVGQR